MSVINSCNSNLVVVNRRKAYSMSTWITYWHFPSIHPHLTHTTHGELKHTYTPHKELNNEMTHIHTQTGYPPPPLPPSPFLSLFNLRTQIYIIIIYTCSFSNWSLSWSRALPLLVPNTLGIFLIDVMPLGCLAHRQQGQFFMTATSILFTRMTDWL